MISAIFACKLREAIISLLTERAAPLRRSLNRADAEKELLTRWSRAVAAIPTITETRQILSKKSLDLSLVAFLKKKKPLYGSEKALNLATKSLNRQHCVHLYSPLSLSDCSRTRIFKRTHMYRNIWTTGNQRGGPLFTISDWFRPRYEPNVCLLLNHRETCCGDFFFLFSNHWSHRCALRFFLVTPLTN